MNVQVLHPNLEIHRRGVPTVWRHEGAAIAIGSGRAVRCWPVEDWRELVELWSTGFTSAQINPRFAARGYSAEEVRAMRALIMATEQILKPIDRAIFVLVGYGRRADRAPGGFTLFDRPVRAADLVAAANKILETLALPQIRYPSAGSPGGASSSQVRLCEA